MRPANRRSPHRHVAVFAVLAVTAALVTGAPGAGSSAAAPATPQTIQVGSASQVTVGGRGNGHGHGLSQYGAQGAAIAGLTAAKIVGFYYPGTTLATVPSTVRIRVLISGATGYTCVGAKAGLTATGVTGYLSTTGVKRFRLVPSGAGLKLQRGTQASCSGTAWTTVKSALPAKVDFTSSQGYVRLFRADGTSTEYRGTVGARRSGTGEMTVNRLGLDSYTMGVVPREMPASWRAAALQAQAIAARTYGEFSREHAGAGSSYDICDTTQCQVYGGMKHYDSAGSLLWTEAPAALSGNSNVVLHYKGAIAFTQYSASDGGWTADGGKPYLVAKADPYDNAASGDPYLTWTRSVPVSSLAGYYGLAKVTSVEITGRDGHGAWGGRVTAGFVNGVDGNGVKQHIATTGFGLQAAMGLPTNWFTALFRAAPLGHVDTMALSATNTYRVAGWSYDPDHSDLSTRVHVYVDSHGYSLVANLPRSDVQRRYGAITNKLGFSTTVTVADGTHRICAFAIDVDGLRNTLLRCATVVVGQAPPVGRVETVTKLSATSYRVTGWSYDPDHPDASTRVHIYADSAGTATTANLARPDIQAQFKAPIAAFGFSATITAPTGTRRICTYGMDIDHVRNPVLGCTAL